MSFLNSDEYTNYIDSSDMIIEYYKNQTTVGLEKYFLEIENWLNKEVDPNNNKPLIIEAEEGVGKKTLIVKWMEYHQANSKKHIKDLIVPNFSGTGGNNSNYYYAIYRILIKLREIFEINQKVELLEEKLRKYFHYWLDVCSRIIHKQVVNDQTVILLFESINHYIDPETGHEANVSMWLPKDYPDNVRVIATVDSKSEAIHYFREMGCNIIKIVSESTVTQSQIDNHLQRPSFINDENYRTKVIEALNSKTHAKKSALFVKTYLSALLPYPSDDIIREIELDKEDFKKIYANFKFDALQNVNSITELNDFLLDYYSENIVPSETFRSVLSLLTISQKGLTATEIFLATKISSEDWNKIIAIFKTFFMKFNNLWKINNETFKKAVSGHYLSNNSYRLKLHLDIADILQKIPNSIRKLEEQTYHLFCGESYFKLKEAVSSIENFLLLFNPNNKYELCRYWQRLEEKGFDPACEYNKAVESFDMHYKPNPQDTFRIILQISRFLKEFSDFETEHTPDFRHPPIKGGDELYDIGLLHEIVKMDMYMPEEWALAKIDGKEVRESLADEKANSRKEKRAGKDPATEQEKRQQRDQSLKKLLTTVKERIDKNISLANSTSSGAANTSQEATHKKITTLLGDPSVLPQDPLISLNNTQKIAIDSKEDDRRNPNRKADLTKQQPQQLGQQQGQLLQMQQSILQSQSTNERYERKNKPKYLQPQKKGPFDWYFETLNVEIDENREVLRKMYMLIGGLIDESDINPIAAKKKSQFAIEEDSKPKIEDKDGEGLETEEIAPTRRGLEGQKEMLERIMEQFQKRMGNKEDSQAIIVVNAKNPASQDRVPLYYYYKRWLWMMFPWVCLSTGLYFSKIMEACFSSATKYMSVKDEHAYTQEALKIAIESKLKKKAMYAKGGNKPADLTSPNSATLKSNINESRAIEGSNTPVPKGKVLGSLRGSFGGRNLSRTIVRDDSFSVEKSRMSNSNLMLDNTSPMHHDTRPFLSTKNANANAKIESHFFVTNEFLNIGYLNNMRDPQPLREESFKRSFANKNDLSMQSSGLHNKTRELKERTRTNVIEREIDGALRDKSLFNNKTDKKLNQSVNSASVQTWLDRHGKKAQNATSLDMNASAILPKLSSSLTLHSDKSLQYAELKVEQLIKECNDIAYRNKQLAKRLKDLKIKKINLDAGSEQDPVILANEKKKELTKKVNHAEKLLDDSKDEQVRLSTIINICLRNKMQNEAWIRDLNYLLQNVRKMIKWEKLTIEKSSLETTEIQKYSLNLYKAIHEKINNHAAFIEHIKYELHSKDILSNKFNNIDGEIENSALMINERLRDTFGKAQSSKEEKKKLAILERNNKNILETLDQLEKDYDKVRDIVEEREDYEAGPKFKEFLNGLEKRNDLDKTAFERKARIARIHEQIQEKQHYLATLKKASEMSSVQKSTLDIHDDTLEDKFKERLEIKEKQLEELTRVNQRSQQALLDAKVTLKTICRKLDVNFNSHEKDITTIPYDQIIAKFEEKLNFVREHITPDQFNLLLRGEYDMEKLYKDSYPMDNLINLDEEAEGYESLR